MGLSVVCRHCVYFRHQEGFRWYLWRHGHLFLPRGAFHWWYAEIAGDLGTEVYIHAIDVFIHHVFITHVPPLRGKISQNQVNVLQNKDPIPPQVLPIPG